MWQKITLFTVWNYLLIHSTKSPNSKLCWKITQLKERKSPKSGFLLLHVDNHLSRHFIIKKKKRVRKLPVLVKNLPTPQFVNRFLNDTCLSPKNGWYSDTVISSLWGTTFSLNCDPCILSAVSALSVIKIEFEHFQSRWQTDWLQWWHHIRQRIGKFPVRPSHVVPISGGHRGKWFLWFLGWGRLIHHQPSTVLYFDVFFFIFSNWAASVLCISHCMCARDWARECRTFFYYFFLLFQSCFVFLNLPHVRLLGGWSIIVLKGRGAPYALCHLISQKSR